MGNVPSYSEKREQIRQVYFNGEVKANQILLWYKEERLRDKPGNLCVLSDNIKKPFYLLKNGRSIGTPGVAKILQNIKPLKLTNKINPSMALLLSTIMSAVDLLPHGGLFCLFLTHKKKKNLALNFFHFSFLSMGFWGLFSANEKNTQKCSKISEKTLFLLQFWCSFSIFHRIKWQNK